MDSVIEVPMYVRSQANPSVEEIKYTLKEMHRLGVISPYIAFFNRLAQYTPPLRLSINIKSMFTVAAKQDIDDLMLHTLTETERLALVELDNKNVNIQAKQIAHGLLNVHERWILWKSMNRSLKEAHVAHKKFLETGWENT